VRDAGNNYWPRSRHQHVRLQQFDSSTQSLQAGAWGHQKIDTNVLSCSHLSISVTFVLDEREMNAGPVHSHAA
jgi:hypothetical protein